MDIWATKDGRLLKRFYNRCSEAEIFAYEIRGMTYADIPEDEIAMKPGYLILYLKNLKIG